MSAFANTMEIDEITMSISAKAYCPLGKDNYTNQFSIMFEPQDTIPDYIDIEIWVKEHINESKVLTIEDSVHELYEYLLVNYNPSSLKVTSSVDDAAHFPVKVTKFTPYN